MSHINYQVYYILSGAWRRRYLILVPMLVLPVLGFFISVFSPKQYASHTSMLIQETAKLNPFLEDLAVSAMLKERMSALQTLIHSRHILHAVAVERGLILDQTSAQQRDQIIAQMSAAISVVMLGKDLIRIDYKSSNPTAMKETLASISRHFIEQLMAPERSSMTDSSHFLAQHLTSRQVELDKAETALALFKQANAADLPELHLSNITRLSRLKQTLSEKKAELAGANRSLGGLDQQLSKSNPVLGQIEEKIVLIQGKLALLRARYTDKHSAIVGALRNLNRLEQERQHLLAQSERNNQSTNIDQLWAIASSAQINNQDSVQPLLISQLDAMQKTRSKVEGLVEEVKSLQQVILDLQNLMSGYGAKASILSKLERELAIKRSLYDDLLLRHEKVGITGSLGIFEQDKRVKVIDRPFTPSSPSNLPLMIFILAGLVGGVFLGCGLATVFELGDSRLRRRDHLTSLTGVAVLSRIPPMVDLTHVQVNP